MIALPMEFGDIATRMSFDDVKSKFFSTARLGLKSQIAWLDGDSYSAKNLILDELLPQAGRGLKTVNIDAADIDKYLGVIEERVTADQMDA